MKKILFDLYYSRKQAECVGKSNTIINIFGKTVNYTEMVEHGKEYSSLYDDVEFVGYAFHLIVDEI